MKRSKKIVVLAHCILNVNAKVAGLALYSGALKSIVNKYIEEGVGIIQLPCPETTFIGLQRWGMTKNQYNTPNYRKHCRQLVVPIVEQLQEYIKNGYTIEAIIGINGSPSCGINFTCSGYCGGMVDQGHTQSVVEIEESGVLMEQLQLLLDENNIDVPLLAIDEKNDCS